MVLDSSLPKAGVWRSLLLEPQPSVRVFSVKLSAVKVKKKYRELGFLLKKWGFTPVFFYMKRTDFLEVAKTVQ
jgi:hypothetical protein